MNENFELLRIHAERFRTNFEALAKIGGTPNDGVRRPALSEAHLEARQWFLERIMEAGLEAKVDGAGNHSAVLHCSRLDAPTLLLGSHLDSVPNGGRFDGALGVLAAFEVLQVVKEAGLSLNMNLEAIDFTDEEGFYVGLLGSLALTGKLKREQLHNPRADRNSFEAALNRAGLKEQEILLAARDQNTIAGYLELHIEQGRRLVDLNRNIGIVTGIVGIRSYKVKFLGRADHAGTTPMTGRLDAAQGASAFTLAARELVLKEFPDCVVNVGNMDFEPGVFNIVPEVVTVALEFRTDNMLKLNELEVALLTQASREAERFGLKAEIEQVGSVSPAPMSKNVQEAFSTASKMLGLTYTRLTSGAGHDAQSLAAICPAGMIFVPSMGGFSHSPREFTNWKDCVNGANVLLQAALKLAECVCK